jgi:hypothetical protein
MNADYSNGRFTLYKVEGGSVPERTFILSSEASRRILYNPQIAGKELQDEMEQLSPLFIEAATEKALKGTKLGDIAEYVLLAGGLYYFMGYGFRKAHGFALPQCFLGIKRQRISESEFIAVSSYENFESLPKEANIIIGDTIATAATMQSSLKRLTDALDANGGRLNRLVICSLACSSEGARRIKVIEKDLKEKYPSMELTLIIAEQLFHLMPDGTDLRFLMKDAIMPDSTREHTLKTYGQALGSDMKCAVFDWGTRCKNPKAHYEEFLSFCEEVLAGGKLDEKGKGVIIKMKEEAESQLKRLETTL